MSLCLRLPWVNHRRPYLAVHIARGGFQLFGGHWRNVYRFGIGIGWQFTDAASSRWYWRDLKGFWRKK